MKTYRTVRTMTVALFVAFVAIGSLSGVAAAGPKDREICCPETGRPSVYMTQDRKWLSGMSQADETPGVVDRALQGPLGKLQELVFAVREPGPGHFYETYGLDFRMRDRLSTSMGAGKLVRLNVHTGEYRIILEEPNSAMRDPYLHYDGEKMLFAWRRAGEPYYNIYEVNLDGTGLRQVTDGEGGRFDDVEPIYLPHGDIMFISGRARRGVPCWTTQVGTAFRCELDGSKVRMVSNAIEHEIHPWPMPDGRILYTRWEYVNRSQTAFHHLWTFNPDGSAVMTFYGNHHPGFAITEARPIAGTNKVAAIFGPGHGVNERRGYVSVIDPDGGPDDKGRARLISTTYPKDSRIPYCWRDVYPLSEQFFLVCYDQKLMVMDDQGRFETLFALDERLKTGMNPDSRRPRVFIHEPRPLRGHPRELIIPDRTDYARSTGTFILSDAAMTRRGEINKPIDRLAIIEVLPMSTSMSWRTDSAFAFGGGYNLKRILGTVPVEEDGSAHFEVPAMRPVYFLALDERGDVIEEMKSFTTLMPGETTSCVGCHEHRTRTPGKGEVGGNTLAALQRAPSAIEPLADVPDILHYPRDIQPIWNKHCTGCHNYEKFAGQLVLNDDVGIRYHNSLTFLDQHRRASRAVHNALAGHERVRLSDREKAMLEWWRNIRWQYSGTYMTFGTAGDEVGVPFTHPEQEDIGDPGAVDLAFDESVLVKRCDKCHIEGKRETRHRKYTGRGWPRAAGYDWYFNMSHPEKSVLLRAPLAKEAGGLGWCKQGKSLTASRGRGKKLPDKTPAAQVFASTDDPDYQALLAELRRMSADLTEKRIFKHAPDGRWRPIQSVVDAYKHYRILPESWDRYESPFDPFLIDEKYYQLFYEPRWYVPGKWPAENGFNGAAK